MRYRPRRRPDLSVFPIKHGSKTMGSYHRARRAFVSNPEVAERNDHLRAWGLPQKFLEDLRGMGCRLVMLVQQRAPDQPRTLLHTMLRHFFDEGRCAGGSKGGDWIYLDERRFSRRDEAGHPQRRLEAFLSPEAKG